MLEGIAVLPIDTLTTCMRLLVSIYNLTVGAKMIPERPRVRV